MTRIGPVDANPYKWPYGGSVDVTAVALICVDWQVDFADQAVTSTGWAMTSG